MIYLVLAVIFLHIISVPIVIRVEAIFDSDRRQGCITVKLFIFTVFKKSVDHKSFESLLGSAGEKSGENERGDDNGAKKRQKSSYPVRFGKTALGRVRVRYLGTILRLGSGDAAATALAVAAVSAAFCDVTAVTGCSSFADMAPDYDRTRIFAHFGGIISLCIGDIIYAALAAIRVKPVSQISGGSVYGSDVAERKESDRKYNGQCVQ